jgi:hypothetical protein
MKTDLLMYGSDLQLSDVFVCKEFATKLRYKLRKSLDGNVKVDTMRLDVTPYPDMIQSKRERRYKEDKTFDEYNIDASSPVWGNEYFIVTKVDCIPGGTGHGRYDKVFPEKYFTVKQCNSEGTIIDGAVTVVLYPNRSLKERVNLKYRAVKRYKKRNDD